MYIIEFHNYEVVKIGIEQADFYNLFLLAIAAALSAIAARKLADGADTVPFLGVPQTVQLRGLAILCVVIGHFWVHVVRQTPLILFGGDAVALFLLLSGFGLTVSGKRQVKNVFGFFRRRAKKVLVPYWLSSIVILALDYYLLDRTYSWQNYALTLSGINLNSIVRNIDYVRWYITFQLFWYVIFALIFRFGKGIVAVILFLAVPSFLFVFDYYVTRFGWYQIFAFPCGVLFGYFFDPIKDFFNHHVQPLTWCVLFSFCLVLLFKIYSYQVVEPLIPSIVFKAVREVTSIVLCLCAIVLCAVLARKGRTSVLLTFLGGISYELFLLHGAFLVKYNPIIHPGTPITVVFSFLLYLLLIILVSLGFKKVVRFVNNIFV